MSVADELSGFWRMLRGLPLQARTDYPSWETQVASFHRLPQPWSIASPDEALSVPAIFRAVSLISNTVGMLNLEVFRNRQMLTDDIPKVAVRPNPFTTQRQFFRDTAFYMASRGEAWWWIAKRDTDGIPLSLYPIPPWEITVEQNPRNRLEPEVKWLNKTIDNDNLRHITYMPDHSGLRGEGPLQKCGAAVSVSVEAQEWAANFFSGSIPSIVGQTDEMLSPAEAEALDAQWAEKPSNLPRWLGAGVKVSDFSMDAAKAQMVETRRFNDGQAAVMFGIPGSLLEYSMPGSSLTYQNVEGEYLKFVLTCLQPYYLEPIEQEMSDLLTRSMICRFNSSEVLRADIKTRSEVFKNLTESGVSGQDAAQIVGFETLDSTPSNVAPVPQAPPQAIPSLLPPDIRAARSAGGVRCAQCHKLLAETATPPYRMTCPRCKTVSEDLQVRTALEPPPPQVINVHPPEVNVHPPQVTVNPAPITFQRGAVQVDAPDMSAMKEAIAGLANQKPPNVRVDVAAPDMSGFPEAMKAFAEKPPTEITFTSPPIDDSLTTAITELRERIENPRVRRIERDADGRMVRLIEESA
jgi:HK97 family phage portal protein